MKMMTSGLCVPKTEPEIKKNNFLCFVNRQMCKKIINKREFFCSCGFVYSYWNHSIKPSIKNYDLSSVIRNMNVMVYEMRAPWLQ